jgi:hypothetical protein
MHADAGRGDSPVDDKMVLASSSGHHPALIAMIELTRGGLCPPLPGRAS